MKSKSEKQSSKLHEPGAEGYSSSFQRSPPDKATLDLWISGAKNGHHNICATLQSLQRVSGEFQRLPRVGCMDARARSKSSPQVSRRRRSAGPVSLKAR